MLIVEGEQGKKSASLINADVCPGAGAGGYRGADASAFPKNANVAATVSLAGIGFDRTQVQLIADPGITENMHEFHAQGVFGEMQIRLSIKPLAHNPKTSALTVWSVLRFLQSTGLGLMT